MMERVRRIGAAQRRRRYLYKIRKEFERCGYQSDGVSDSKIEAALARINHKLSETSMSAKAIYLTLRRLRLVGRDRNAQKNGRAA